MNARNLALLAGLVVLAGVAVVMLDRSADRGEELGLDSGIAPRDQPSEGPAAPAGPAPDRPEGTKEAATGAVEPATTGPGPDPEAGGGTYAVKARVLDAETGQPLEGARVRLFEEGKSETLQQTLTGASGWFELRGLEREVVYGGSVWKQGYAEIYRHGLELPSDDETAVVELDPIRLARAGSVSGSVSTVRGNLIAGAKVLFHPLRKTPEGLSYPDRSESYSAFTDENGFYRNGSLPAGAYRVMAQAAGHARSMLPRLEVRPGDTAEADFELEPERCVSGTVRDRKGAPVKGATILGDFRGKGGPFELPETASAGDGTFTVHHLPAGTCNLVVSAEGYAEVIRPGVPVPSENVAIVLGLADSAIEGTVSGPDGPLDAFRIKYYEEKPSNYQLAAVAILKAKWKRFEEAGGAYRLEGLAGGLYALEVYAEGCLGKKKGGIELEEGETRSGVDFDLARGYAVRGRVVRKADGAPIRGAAVMVNLVIKGPFGELPFQPSDVRTATDEEGAWELPQMKEGTLSISVTHEDYGKATRTGIPVRPDEPPDEVVIRMEPGGRVSGTCRDAKGRGVFGDYIVIQQPQDPSMRYTLQTDEEGGYASDLLSPGIYQVVRVDGKDTSKVKVKFVTVKSGETVTVDFRVSDDCRVHGTVTDGGKPVQNCQVVLVRKGGESGKRGEMGVSTTDEKGRYELLGVKPGEYYALAQTGQMQGTGRARTFRVAFSVAAGEFDKRVDVAFPSGSFFGTVMDAATGEPLAGVTVMVMQSDSPDVRTFDEIIEYYGGQARTDDQGAFDVGGLPPGRYNVQAIQAGYARKILENRDLGAGERVKLLLSLGPESRIEGVVSGPGGEPVENAAVYLLDEEGRTTDFTFGTTFSDANGAYEVQGLPAGSYIVLVEAPGHASVRTGALAVPAQGVVKKDFSLGPEARIRAVVTSGGAAVKDAVVRVFDRAGREVLQRINERNMYTSTRKRRTDARGTVVVPLLPAGAYHVTVTAGGSTKAVDVVLDGPGEKIVSVEMGP